MLPDPFSRPHKEKREKAVWLRETISEVVTFIANAVTTSHDTMHWHSH